MTDALRGNNPTYCVNYERLEIKCIKCGEVSKLYCIDVHNKVRLYKCSNCERFTQVDRGLKIVKREDDRDVICTHANDTVEYEMRRLIQGCKQPHPFSRVTLTGYRIVQGDVVMDIKSGLCTVCKVLYYNARRLG
jgi:hypothetical protein